jgi:hypothetical protein
MSITKILTSQTIPYYSEKVDLDGENFILTFKWNVREEAWYFSIYQEDETPVAVGIKLVTGWNPIRRLSGSDRPLGIFYTYDTTETDTEPSFSTLGTQVQLLYVEHDTAVEILAEAA